MLQKDRDKQFEKQQQREAAGLNLPSYLSTSTGLDGGAGMRVHNKDSLLQAMGVSSTPMNKRKKIVLKDSQSGSAARGGMMGGLAGMPPKTPGSMSSAGSRRTSGITGGNNNNLWSGSDMDMPSSYSPTGASLKYESPSHSLQMGPSPSALKFADRVNRNKRVDVLNEHVPTTAANSQQSAMESLNKTSRPLEIALPPGQQTEGYRYMFERLSDRGDYLDERIDSIASVLAEHIASIRSPEEQKDGEGNEEPESIVFSHPAQPTQEPIVTAGRICPDTLVEHTRLNDASIVLEASRQIGVGCRVKLNLSGLLAPPSITGTETAPGTSSGGFALFPGQIVSVEGTNPSGRLINVTKIHHPPMLPQATTPISRMLEWYPPDNPQACEQPVVVSIVSGPYTLEDSLEYEPLEELTKLIAGEDDADEYEGMDVEGDDDDVKDGDDAILKPTDKKAKLEDSQSRSAKGSARTPNPNRRKTPFSNTTKKQPQDQVKSDVLIMMGPFVDLNHPMIARGEVDMMVEEMFRIHIAARIERMIRGTKRRLKVILVPSTRDAVTEWMAFPQPPLGSALNNDERNARRKELGLGDGSDGGSESWTRNVFLFPNPVQFTVNEVVFAVSTMDVLMHLGGEETARFPMNPVTGLGGGVTGGKDRISRLFRHVLEQRSFYPLFPPASAKQGNSSNNNTKAGTTGGGGLLSPTSSSTTPTASSSSSSLFNHPASIDLSHYPALDLQATPDVLILPSQLLQAARNVDGV
ncbi:DNA-directed DNA polymerase alpha subunit pol12, partial [Quaeritorhiza haematococci]